MEDRAGIQERTALRFPFQMQMLLSVTKKLLENEATRMCGLGPRDSLRLEAGLCLYGEQYPLNLLCPLCLKSTPQTFDVILEECRFA